MNKNYLEGENYTTFGERLEREIVAELIEHKKAILRSLRALGHTVVQPENLESSYVAEGWLVNGDDVDMCFNILRRDSYPHRPTGCIRIEVGNYKDRRKFIQRTSLTALKKYPKGFDYAEIAKEMIDNIQRAKVREVQQETAVKQANKNDAVAISAGVRLMREFQLGKPSYFGEMHAPLSFDRGYEYLNLKFTELTEDQARAIMRAAHDCGAMSANEE